MECIPASLESPILECSSVDLGLRSGLDSTERRADTGAYGPVGGRGVKSRIKGKETRFMTEVPRDSRRRNRPGSPLNRTADNVDQKKALRPNAARGNAVAVPRCSGKFVAARLDILDKIKAGRLLVRTSLDRSAKGRTAPETSQEREEGLEENTHRPLATIISYYMSVHPYQKCGHNAIVPRCSGK